MTHVLTQRSNYQGFRWHSPDFHEPVPTHCLLPLAHGYLAAKEAIGKHEQENRCVHERARCQQCAMELPLAEDAHGAGQLHDSVHTSARDPQLQDGSKHKGSHSSAQIQCVFVGLCIVLALVLEPVVRYTPTTILRVSLATAWWLFRALAWQLLKITLYAVLLGLFLGSIWISYRLCKLIYNIIVFKSPNLDLSHDCITPESFNHKRPLQGSTKDFFGLLYNGLADLSDEGSVLYMKPLKLVEDILANGLEAATADLWDIQQCTALQEAMTKPLPELLERQEIRVCMQHWPPAGIVLVGTAHVSRKSADDTKRVILVSGASARSSR